MNLCFIGSFLATSGCLLRHQHAPLLAKKGHDDRLQGDSRQKGPSPFRINRRTTVEINIEDDPKIRTYQDVLKKLALVMKTENIDKILNNRPTRHYPKHYYKRLIKQRKGFQMSDARREAYYARHTQIDSTDDIAFLRDRHLDKILEAVYAYDDWLAKSKARGPGSGDPEE